MKYISLKEIIDDILLLVRNNNISESEDLSRALIMSWINAYRRFIWKERLDALKDRYKNNLYNEITDLVDDEVLSIKEIEMELKDVESKDGSDTHTKTSVDTIPDVFNNACYSILAIHDASGENIQYMNHIRRRYHYYRRYTFGDMTAYYMDDKHMYVQGLVDKNALKYIYVLYIAQNNDGGTDDDNNEDPDEDDIKIPDWMVPRIKDLILKNELAFMLNRPSDDSNNATLASVKPHGPQDEEQ